MLFGRAAALDAIVAAAGSTAGPPLIVLSGPAGSGRSALLAEAGRRLGDRVSHLRLAYGDRQRPYVGLTRLAAEAINLGTPVDEAELTQWRRTMAGLIAGAPAAADRAATMLAGVLTEAGPAVLLADDAQWLDPASLSVLEPLVRQLAGSKVTCVVTSDESADRAPADRLRADGLARLIRLRPLSAGPLAALIADTLQATPEPALVRTLARASRGRPAALLAALEGYRQADAIRIADRHAYLVRPHQPLILADNHPVLAPVVRLGEPAWPVARALALLRPLDGPLTELIATALDRPEALVAGALDELRAAGILLPGGRFRVPVLAEALAGSTRPYERRRLAQVAVTAVWEGRARCADPDYLADRLVDAGRLVDRERARGELLARAGTLMLEGGGRAEPWLRAAAELTADRAQRAQILVLHAASCFLNGDYRAAVDSTTLLLRECTAFFDENARQELEIIHVTALRGLGDTAELARLAAEEPEPGRATVTTAAVLCALDRWREVSRLLAANPDEGSAVAADLAEIFRAGAELWLGRPARFDRDLADRGRWRLNDVDRHHQSRVGSQVRLLLMRGELRRAQKLLAEEELPVARLSTTDRSLLAGATGDWRTAMDLARLSIATGTAPGYEPGHSAMYQLAGTILLGSGRPNRARALLDAAATAAPVLSHLLTRPAAAVDRAFGFPELAAGRLTDGLKLAAEHGVVLGTDLLWFDLADVELILGRPDHARAHLAELDRVAAIMGGSRPELHAMILRAILRGDRSLATEAIRLARRRGQPYEQVYTVEILVRHGVSAPDQLLAAYELLEGLGALLYRAWLRGAMRDHDLAVPGRKVATEENERLLAELVTEGLSNRQLAAVLRTSGRSVEGRLSRLFSRTGYRSRVELATAMLTGENVT